MKITIKLEFLINIEVNIRTPKGAKFIGKEIPNI